MKMFIIASMVLLAFVIISFSILKSRENKKMQKKWSMLLSSETAEDELKNITALTEFVTSRNGYWEVMGMDKENVQYNMPSYVGAINEIINVNVTFYWRDKSFKGINWNPVDSENIYEFFRDK